MGYVRGASDRVPQLLREIGLPVADFCALCLEAMQEISDDLGL